MVFSHKKNHRRFGFEILSGSSNCRARTGIIKTGHGSIMTPCFVPVGTQATVKSLTPEELADLKTQIFFVNTYHMFLRPGLEVIAGFGGLHRFMNWQRPIITDSGGFQIFSLNSKKYINLALSEAAVLDRQKFVQKQSLRQLKNNQVYPDEYRPVGELVAVDDSQVIFTSHWDGSKYRFDPEVSMRSQKVLGSDIMISFDECTAYPADYKTAKKSLVRTHNWTKQCFEYYRKNMANSFDNYQALYSVVQGSVYRDLRIAAAEFNRNLEVDGFAIGGVSVGETKKEMTDVLKWVVPLLPEDKPRHLLGVGEIDDIFNLIENGVDTFDCVQPTRLARMGQLYSRSPELAKSRKYTFDITQKIFAKDTGPVEPGCGCYCCRNYSRGYLHHLFRVKELLSYRLATIHNIYFVQELVSQIRIAIENDNFDTIKKQWSFAT